MQKALGLKSLPRVTALTPTVIQKVDYIISQHHSQYYKTLSILQHHKLADLF